MNDITLEDLWEIAKGSIVIMLYMDSRDKTLNVEMRNPANNCSLSRAFTCDMLRDMAGAKRQLLDYLSRMANTLR